MDIFDLIFPKSCLNCGREGRYICQLCVSKVVFHKQLCPYCGKASLDGVTHVICHKKNRLNGAFSVWSYQGVIRTAIIKLKYKFAWEVANELADYMVLYLKKQPVFPRTSILAPIPLYFLKENFRGFNQSEVVGELLARKMGWDFNSDILIRKRFRRPQTELKGKERRKNIKGVFSLNPLHRSPITDHQSLILFDDVYTTGSTMKEAAKVLKTCLRRQGSEVREVWGLTIAR